MKKKGFTLVELLAVIAILAILVIVAMPNVLGMFNQAKSSTFTTEVQTLMDTASTKFMTLALTQQGKDLQFYSDGTNSVNGLDMDGASKNYYVEMNRNGEFKRVIVWDKNFCYDSKDAGFTVDGTGNGFIDKAKVKVTNVREIGTDTGVTSTKTGTNVTINYNANTVYCNGSAAQN